MRPDILVIEDDRDSRELLDHFLSHHGYAVSTASNGLEGLQKARDDRPALILLDLHMPVMDGVAFRRHQLRDPDIAAVPLICVSAIDDATRVATQLGADAHVGKPIDLDRLLCAVRGALSARRETGRGARARS